MTNPLISSTVPDDAGTQSVLIAGDAERIATAVDAKLAPSTRQTYAVAWRLWERWCQTRGIAVLPAPPEALAAFLTERAEAGLTSGTLDGYCSGIAYRHCHQGLSDPTSELVVRCVRRGLRRIMGVAPRRQAHPLTVAEVARIVSAIDSASAIGVRDRAVILLGYASALRPGELSALDACDIVPKPTGVLVTVRRSETDQDARGQARALSAGSCQRVRVRQGSTASR